MSLRDRTRRFVHRMASGLVAGMGMTGDRRTGRTLARTVSDSDFVVLDLEMTGLDPRRDAIITIGAVRMRGGRILPGRAFSARLRPHCALNPDAVVIHGLLPDETAHHEDAATALAAFRTFCGEATIAGWHVGLDAAFLRRAAGMHDLPQWRGTMLDVRGLHLALRSRLPAPASQLSPKDADLYATARSLGVDVANAHDALGDAWITAEVLQRLLAHGGCAPLQLRDVLRLASAGLRSLHGETAMTF